MRRWAGLILGILLGCCTFQSAAASCTLAYTNLSFGTYTGTLLTGVNQATVNCTSGTQYTLGLNAGTGSGATTTTRKMTSSSGATLSYQIFQDAARTRNWGNTTGVDTVAMTGTARTKCFTFIRKYFLGNSLPLEPTPTPFRVQRSRSRSRLSFRHPATFRQIPWRLGPTQARS